MLKLKALIAYIIFSVLITTAWQWYEIEAFGEVKPDNFHTAIAIVLAFSLTLNVVQWELFKKHIAEASTLAGTPAKTEEGA